MLKTTNKFIRLNSIKSTDRTTGFTLVEILIVISIIGVLASFLVPILLSVKSKARDDQRFADIKNIEQSLELFKIKCGFYPGKIINAPSNPECRGGTTSNIESPIGWRDLEVILKDADIGVNSIPRDPDPSRSYFYSVQLGSTLTPRGQCYILGAQLENSSNNLLKNDLDDADLLAKLPPRSCNSFSCKNLFPQGPSCDDPEFCVGNKECLYW